jgi:hypothetical protein
MALIGGALTRNNRDIVVVEPEPIEDLETWPPEVTPPPIRPH